MAEKQNEIPAQAAPGSPPAMMFFPSGELTGPPAQRSRKTLADLRNLFAHPEAADAAPDSEVYSVQWFAGGKAAAEGSLLWGCTHLQASRAGDEYFMTHGHFHALPTRAEIYLVASGHGLLLHMERSGHTWAESMTPGAVHYIHGEHAHRVVNTGTQPLVFWSCWPGDAGYDYASIAQHGFGLRVFEQHGEAVIVPSPNTEGSAP